MRHIIMKLLPGKTDQQVFGVHGDLPSSFKDVLGAVDQALAVIGGQIPSPQWAGRFFDHGNAARSGSSATRRGSGFADL